MNSNDSTNLNNEQPKSSRPYFPGGLIAEDKSINNFLVCPPLKMLMTLNSPSLFKSKPIQFNGESSTSKNSARKLQIDPKVNLEKLKPFNPHKRATSMTGDLGTNRNLTSRSEKPDTERDIKNANISYKQSLLNKDKEIERLHSQIAEMQKNVNNKTLITQRNNMMLDLEINNSLSFYDLENIDPQRQKEILHALIVKTNESYKTMKERNVKLANLCDSFENGIGRGMTENNLAKVKTTIEELVMTLTNATNTEIELGIKGRDNEKKALEIARQKMAYERLQSQYKHIVQENGDLKRQKQDLESKILNQERLLLIEKNNNSENLRKISVFEKRIELILEADVSVDKDKLRKAITELVKENDHLKRSIEIKDKEAKKQTADMLKLQNKISRLNKKIETLSKNKKTSRLGQGTSDDHEQDPKVEKDAEADNDEALNLLHSPIPLTLDFRTSSLKLQYVNLLNDLFDKGAFEFVNYFNNIEDADDKKQILTFVSNQLISMREFSDKLHFFFKETLELMKCKEIAEAQILLNKYFKVIFSAQILNLWVPDGLTGILYTINASHEMVRCLASKGLISEVIKNRKAYNKRNLENSYICELTSIHGKYKVNNTIIVPIKKSNGKVMAVLEISNNVDSHFGFDEEYFASLLSHVLANIIQKMHTTNTIVEDNKMKYLILETFVKLTECTNRFDFVNTVKKYVNQVFGVSSSSFMFVEGDKFIVYKSDTECAEYSTDIGFSGQICQAKKGRILSDASTCREYNGLVDLYSIMPLYCLPIIIKDEATKAEKVIGILQLVVKTRGFKSKSGMEDLDDFIENTGADEPIENLLNIFSNLIATSLIHQKNFTVQF